MFLRAPISTTARPESHRSSLLHSLRVIRSPGVKTHGMVQKRWLYTAAACLVLFFLEVGGCTVKMAKSSLPSAEFALRLKTPGASEGWFFPKPPPEPGPDWDRSHRSGAASRPSSCQVGRLERAQSDAAPPTGAAHRGAADRADRADRSAGGEGE